MVSVTRLWRAIDAAVAVVAAVNRAAVVRRQGQQAGETARGLCVGKAEMGMLDHQEPAGFQAADQAGDRPVDIGDANQVVADRLADVSEAMGYRLATVAVRG